MELRARSFLRGRAVITVIVNRPRCDYYCYGSYWKRGLLWTVGQVLHSRVAPVGSSNLGSSHRSPPPSALSRGGPQSHPVKRNPRLQAVKGLIHGRMATDPTNFGPRGFALHLCLCPVRSERMLQDTPPEVTRLPSAFDFLWLEMGPDSSTDTWAGRLSRVPGATPSRRATGSPLCWGRLPWTSSVVLSLI